MTGQVPLLDRLGSEEQRASPAIPLRTARHLRARRRYPPCCRRRHRRYILCGVDKYTLGALGFTKLVLKKFLAIARRPRRCDGKVRLQLPDVAHSGTFAQLVAGVVLKDAEVIYPQKLYPQLGFAEAMASSPAIPLVVVNTS